MSHTADDKDEIHRHSGWVIPLGLLLVILALCGLFLLWYLRPGPRVASGAPTDQATLVRVRVHGAPFAIPANYIASAPARSGSARDSLALLALFPGFHGYSDDDARLFSGNAPDSPVIHLTLRGDIYKLDARQRLARVYSPYLANTRGHGGPFDLRQYDFAADSGYGRSELFAGSTASGLILFLCEKEVADLPSPNCLAVERPLARGISLSYRFKRAYLARWREIDGGVDALVARFSTK